MEVGVLECVMRFDICIPVHKTFTAEIRSPIEINKVK